MQQLDDQAIGILDFETQWWRYAGAKPGVPIVAGPAGRVAGQR